MASLKIIPVLGRKVNVPADDSSMFAIISEGVAFTHDAGGLNIDYQRKPNACTKSFGYSAWANSAPASPNHTHGLFELDDGTNRDNIIFETGRVFRYDATPDPVQINNVYIDYDNLAGGSFAVGDTVTGATAGTAATVVHIVESGTVGTLYLKDLTGGDGGFDNNEQLGNGGGVTADANGTEQHTIWSNADGTLYSAIRYGSYMVFADDSSGHTPQKWKNGDNNLTNLITKSGATLYKFKYLVEWQRRVIGAYSNQTNGDLEIRWTDALPTWTDLDFAAANQLYKPITDSISGISKLGANAIFLYGTDSITRLLFYPDADVTFAFNVMVENEGCASHHSIVNYKGANWFFNKNYGFVRYLGGSKIVSEDIISKDIESDIQGIDSRYYGKIVGKAIPQTEEIVWALPLAGATSPSHLAYYNTRDGRWRLEDKACRYIDMWTRAAGEYRKPVFANADGFVYQIAGETLPSTANLDGYRIEPIMDFGDGKTVKSVNNIWFGIVEGGDYSIDVYWRKGDTVKELLAQSWTSVGSLSLNNPEEAVININQSGRYHQLKWGSNLDSEKFTINWIEFIFTYEGSGY